MKNLVFLTLITLTLAMSSCSTKNVEENPTFAVDSAKVCVCDTTPVDTTSIVKDTLSK